MTLANDLITCTLSRSKTLVNPSKLSLGLVTALNSVLLIPVSLLGLLTVMNHESIPDVMMLIKA